MEEDNSLNIEQNVGNVDGDFTKSITIDMEDDGSSEMGDVEAVLDLTYNVFQYIPEILFVSVADVPKVPVRHRADNEPVLVQGDLAAQGTSLCYSPCSR